MIKVELSKIEKKASSVIRTAIGVGAEDRFSGLAHLASQCIRLGYRARKSAMSRAYGGSQRRSTGTWEEKTNGN